MLKMIYLIDDNKYGQMSENYKLDFTEEVESRKEYITWLQKIPDSIDGILSNAACILIHDSLEEKEDKERLVARAKNKEIPYGLFSNSFTATEFDGASISKIRKDRLYNNLLVFIGNFKDKGTIDLNILSYGLNYEIEKASIIQDRLINNALLINKENFNYEVVFRSGSSHYKDLMELFRFSNPSDDFSEFDEALESKVTNAQSMRDEIITMVKNIKKKYGK